MTQDNGFTGTQRDQAGQAANKDWQATDDWQARIPATLHSAERYSRFVKAMRIVLPALAIGLVSVVIIYSVTSKPNTQIAMTYDAVEETAGLVAMTGPRFSGMDIDGRYYVVTADEAKRPAGKFDKIELAMVHAEVREDSEARLVLNADEGTLDADANHLVFGPAVLVDLQDGFRFKTDHAFADLTTGIVKGQTPLHGESPFGTFAADRFELSRKEEIVRLYGHVTFTINPDFLDDAPQNLDDLKDRRAIIKKDAETTP